MKALVTGASRGIGAAVARLLARQGAAQVLVARDGRALAEVAAQAPGATTLVADLARSQDVVDVVDEAATRLGGLDVLVNCAGIVRYAAVGDVTLADLQAQLDVNFVAPFLLTQRAAEHMQKGGGGSVVHVASTLGVKPAPETAAYAASKAALLSMTRSFALELGPHGIRVNAVVPGVIDTDMVRVARPSTQGQGQSESQRIETQLSALARLHPLGRLGTSEEVADSVLYLLSASFVTGAALAVDGGLLLC